MSNKFILLGTVREGKTNIIGYRLLSLSDMSGSVIPSNQIVNFLHNNYVLGAAFEKGKVVGTNGTIDRYPIINSNGQLVMNNAVIVLSAKGSNFLCSDYNGTIVSFTEAELIQYCSKSGNSIANGKIVTKGNKQYISAISGVYPELNMPAEKKQAPIKEPQTQEEILADIKRGLNRVAKEVIKRGYGVRDYDAVGDAMMETGVYLSHQMKDTKNFEKVVQEAIKLFKASKV